MNDTIHLHHPRPTDAELAVLRVLWSRGPTTAREVWETLNADRERPVVYTTVLKIMQTMTVKGLLSRDETARSHVYHPNLAPDETRRSLVSDMLGRLFDGSVRELVVHALGAKRVSREELREIRRILDIMEGRS
jgi:predicted transcriptional regulator